MEFLALSTNRKILENVITINDDLLSLKIVDNTAPDIPQVTLTGSFNLSELLANNSQDHGCIALIPQGMNTDSKFLAIETTQLSLPSKTGVNLSLNTPDTLPGKQHAGSPFSVINKLYGTYAFLYILTPYKGCSKEDVIFIYRDTDNAEITIDNQKIEGEKINSLKAFLDTWLPITIEGPDTIAAGVKQVYTVTAPAKAIVELSADIGVINRSRILNGGNFVLNTESLNAGEVITIKSGYKYWTGVSTKTITLS